ncbi:hypothetical protein BC567DRAFT_231295 [Phyllosticta citribraziliensis]
MHAAHPLQKPANAASGRIEGQDVLDISRAIATNLGVLQPHNLLGDPAPGDGPENAHLEEPLAVVRLPINHLASLLLSQVAKRKRTLLQPAAPLLVLKQPEHGLALPPVFLARSPRDHQAPFHVQLEDKVVHVGRDWPLDVVRDPERELGHGWHVDGGAAAVCVFELHGRVGGGRVFDEWCRVGYAGPQRECDVSVGWHGYFRLGG